MCSKHTVPPPVFDVCITPPGPIFHARYLLSVLVGIVPVPKRSALETPRRELSEDVCFRVGTLLVVEQSGLENCRAGV